MAVTSDITCIILIVENESIYVYGGRLQLPVNCVSISAITVSYNNISAQTALALKPGYTD